MNLLVKAILLTTLLFVTHLSAAAAEFHEHPELKRKSDRIKRITLLPPQIEMFEMGAGGGLEKMEEWSQAARTHTRQALKGEFAKRNNLRLAELDERNLPSTSRSTFDETLRVYNVVSNAILAHSFANQPTHLFFPWKARDFTYSLGKEVETLASDVDAFFLVRGFDQRSSAGRTALGIGTALVGAAFGVIAIPRGGGNLFTAALVDAHTGDILWFSTSTISYDLRNPEEATQLVIEFMADFPTLGSVSQTQ